MYLCICVFYILDLNFFLLLSPIFKIWWLHIICFVLFFIILLMCVFGFFFTIIRFKIFLFVNSKQTYMCIICFHSCLDRVESPQDIKPSRTSMTQPGGNVTRRELHLRNRYTEKTCFTYTQKFHNLQFLFFLIHNINWLWATGWF